MFVGEVPGDEEDLQGRPFVGPAGKLLRRILKDIGLDAKEVYFTNVVKHFKWEPRGKRRLHKKPSAREIAACRPWLDDELSLLKPEVLVCLGATAAQALLGREFRVSQQRGRKLASALAKFVMATVHPSSILRAPTERDRRLAREQFVRDLKVAAQAARAHPP
jgi:DNA polymerase